MSPQIPTIGRVVYYRLTDEDATKINRRRTTDNIVAARIATGQWWEGAQAHIGNPAVRGDELAATIVSVHPDHTVNLQVMLDGTDTFWATKVPYAVDGAESAMGCWRWPPRV